MDNEEDLFERLRALEAENQQLRQYNAYFRHKAGEWDQVCEWLPQVLPPQSASAAALSITDSQSLLDYVSSNSVPLSVHKRMVKKAEEAKEAQEEAKEKLLEETASGHYIPPNTKILTLVTNNPRMTACRSWKQKKQQQQSNSLLEEGSVSSAIRDRPEDQEEDEIEATGLKLQVKELQTELDLSKLRMERLQNQWQQVKNHIAELRFAVRALFGYQLDIGRDDDKQRTYRTTSYYNPHLALTFVVSHNSLSLADSTLPVESFDREMRHLRKSKAIPYFLSSLTVRYFDQAASGHGGSAPISHQVYQDPE